MDTQTETTSIDSSERRFAIQRADGKWFRGSTVKKWVRNPEDAGIHDSSFCQFMIEHSQHYKILRGCSIREVSARPQVTLWELYRGLLPWR